MQLLLFCQGCQQGTKKQWCSWNPLIWKPRWDLNHMQHVLWDDESTLLLLENFLLYITELLCCCFQQDGGQPWSRQQQKQRQRGLESKTCPPPPLCRKCHVSCTKSFIKRDMKSSFFSGLLEMFWEYQKHRQRWMKLRKQNITAASLKGNKFTAISPKRMSWIKGLNMCPHARNLKKLKTKTIYIYI